MGSHGLGTSEIPRPRGPLIGSRGADEPGRGGVVGVSASWIFWLNSQRICAAAGEVQVSRVVLQGDGSNMFNTLNSLSRGAVGKDFAWEFRRRKTLQFLWLATLCVETLQSFRALVELPPFARGCIYISNLKRFLGPKTWY